MNERLFIVIRVIARVLLRILYPVKVSGLSNIPDTGAVLLCGNHLSLIDPVIIASVAKRPISFMAKAELFSKRLFAQFLKALGAFPVKRGETDMAAIRASMTILKEGKALGIFPQGSRSQEKMENGVGLLAQRSRATVIPIRIIGPYRPFRRFQLIIGPAVDLKELEGRSDSASIEEATRRIEQAIWSLS